MSLYSERIAVVNRKGLLIESLEELLNHIMSRELNGIVVAVLSESRDIPDGLRIRLNKKRVTLGTKEYQFLYNNHLDFVEPFSNSPTSNAVYIAKSKGLNGEGFLLQWLPKDSRTSRHFHKRETETYLNLDGECTLEVDERMIRLKHGIYTVKPYEIHQLFTEECPCLNLLHIKGSSIDELEHYYVEN